ncbi:MAG TPA: hypothetical protein DCX32_02995 [Candidatus Moranbacteria bacterium]|nr:MAG: hypothetical protein UW87_C0014G0004 [Candidatus Moranbacteria bacterium GW2011_GWC2_45_10]HAV11487.1 hypothetical protein [Candidatus Moranbacteria bacterium]
MGAIPCRFESDQRHKSKHLRNYTIRKSKKLAYIIGAAIGDGNLSNPNRRAVRLRITCDNKYPKIIKRILENLQELFPENKVSLVKKQKNCTDISCYSNKLENILEWKATNGSKFKQKISIPEWIKEKDEYIKPCIKGLIETDGSVYYDRKYLMVNFVTIIPTIANDVMEMMRKIGYKPNMQTIKESPVQEMKYTIRISKNAEEFVKDMQINKS